MSSNNFAVAGYASRSPSAKSAYTRPSSSSNEIASARISRSDKSLKFRAMPTSLLVLDSVSNLALGEVLIKLVHQQLYRHMASQARRSTPGNSCLLHPRHPLPTS